MAPNRKAIASREEILSSNDLQGLLQTTVQPKFLPLTHPEEQQQHESQKVRIVPQHTSAVEDSASYWEWTADVEEERRVFHVAVTRSS